VERQLARGEKDDELLSGRDWPSCVRRWRAARKSLAELSALAARAEELESALKEEMAWDMGGVTENEWKARAEEAEKQIEVLTRECVFTTREIMAHWGPGDLRPTGAAESFCLTHGFSHGMPRARAALASVPPAAAECPHGDPACPCPDGCPCHYEGADAWPAPEKEEAC
jgi:hypothetical protein